MARAGTGLVRMTVKDDGVGLPAGLDFRRSDSLGLQLVCTLLANVTPDHPRSLSKNGSTAMRARPLLRPRPGGQARLRAVLSKTALKHTSSRRMSKIGQVNQSTSGQRSSRAWPIRWKAVSFSPNPA